MMAVRRHGWLSYSRQTRCQKHPFAVATHKGTVPRPVAVSGRAATHLWGPTGRRQGACRHQTLRARGRGASSWGAGAGGRNRWQQRDSTGLGSPLDSSASTASSTRPHPRRARHGAAPPDSCARAPRGTGVRSRPRGAPALRPRGIPPTPMSRTGLRSRGAPAPRACRPGGPCPGRPFPAASWGRRRSRHPAGPAGRGAGRPGGRGA